MTFTGTPGLLLVTMMLRVIGSLPAVKLPKLTMTGVTETRGRTMPETGISSVGCCATPVVIADRRVQEAVRRVGSDRDVELVLLAGAAGDLVLVAGREDLRLHVGLRGLGDRGLEGLLLGEKDHVLAGRCPP